MRKINVVCFGSCDMYPTYGFVAGLKEAGVNVISYGESANCVYSVLYHLHRQENQLKIFNSDLIILGITDTIKECAPSYMMAYKILYKSLWKLNKKIVVYIWWHARLDVYGTFHHRQCRYYGFNIIDVQSFSKKKGIFEFYSGYTDYGHPLYSLMATMSKKLIQSYDKLCFPKENINCKCTFEFFILPVSNLIASFNPLKIRTFTCYENIYVINNHEKIKIPNFLKGMTLFGIHAFNRSVNAKPYKVSMTLKNKNMCIPVHITTYNHVAPVNTGKLVVDEETYIWKTNKGEFEEPYPIYVHGTLDNEANIGLIALFFIKNNNEEHFNEEHFNEEHFNEEHFNEEHEIDEILDFLVDYKNIITDYNKRMDPVKISFYQKEIADLKSDISNKNKLIEDKVSQIQKLDQNLNQIRNKLSFQTKYGTAKFRIQNQLSYKLGQVMIVNSKSLLGYITMFMALLSIIISHKQNQKIYQEKTKKDPSLKLPSLETYPDYKEALKEKECFTYKLGEALIRANNNWYGAGYVKLLLEIRKLKKEYKKK